MTDIQTWVDEDGDFTPEVDPEVSIDLSGKLDAVRMLRKNLKYYVSLENTVRYLNLAKCILSRVPKIFHFRSGKGDFLSDTLEYLTLYGNHFMDTSAIGQQYQMTINATGVTEVEGLGQFRDGRNMWYMGFDAVTFKSLKELDLRACSIETIDRFVFRNMPNLEALYLGENKLHAIGAKSFNRLTNLVHIDISRNNDFTNNGPRLLAIDKNVFQNLTKLRSIDMSFTLCQVRAFRIVSKLGPGVQRLSLCWTGTHHLNDTYFNNSPVKYLDLSGNLGILDNANVLKGIRNSLQVLYATDVALKNFSVFENLNNLEILKLSNNDITTIRREVAASLNKLQVLDLDKNRYVTWLKETFRQMRSLRFLSMRENNINVISKEIMNDIKEINYVGLADNLLVCNCLTRELIEVAAMNEFRQHELLSMSSNDPDERPSDNFITALPEFNSRISKRVNISYVCDMEGWCDQKDMPNNNGSILLLDYNAQGYLCSQAIGGEIVPLIEVNGCNTREYNDIDEGLNRSTNLMFLLLLPGLLLPTLLVLFVFRRSVRYFFMAMRNSATLSLISKDEVMDDTRIYNYDVFVSYCHEDRAWMLDQLLPHLETKCCVSVCLHERDFQVGLSILENIVSCMDRSRTIILIISKQFLKSQWCQFEMHLAQHRLLETRREDLMLVLLEDIPRRLRPNTLHYLMLTKTYIVWPKEQSEQALFWKRLKKSLVTQKNKLHGTRNVTLSQS